MNGIEACAKINQYLHEEEKNESLTVRSKCIPFIYALTSEMDEEDLQKIKRAGFKKICKYHNT